MKLIPVDHNPFAADGDEAFRAANELVSSRFDDKPAKPNKEPKA
jgi:hypothetical protein